MASAYKDMGIRATIFKELNHCCLGALQQTWFKFQVGLDNKRCVNLTARRLSHLEGRHSFNAFNEGFNPGRSFKLQQISGYSSYSM